MIFSRRSFFAAASGLFLPYEPERIYSFLPAWRLVNRVTFEREITSRRVVVLASQEPDRLWVGGPGHRAPPVPGLPGSEFTWRNKLAVIHPSNLLDLQKSAEAYGLPLRFMGDA